MDSTSATWKAASEIVFEFSSLVMPKSAVTAVYVIDTLPRDQYDKALRGTILKSWIKNNRLHIEKIDYFDDYGPLTIVVASAYPTGAQREQVVKDGFVPTGIENQGTETTLDKKCLLVKDNYVFCQMTFNYVLPINKLLRQSKKQVKKNNHIKQTIFSVYSRVFSGCILPSGRLSAER